MTRDRAAEDTPGKPLDIVPDPGEPLANRHIVLGISAGIAAYKAPILVRALRARGADVQVVLTENAHRFVTPAALQAVAGRPVRQSLWDEAAEAAMGHIELARWADLVVIAPATANTLAHLAQGQAGDLLTTLCLATSAPVLLAPAMNQQMYQHAATQANLAQLDALNYFITGPDSGDQACGETGPGRMVEPDQIADTIQRMLTGEHRLPGVDTRLQGCRVVITAGPTVEAIDPVRFISNHSSGRQGLAMAEAARRAGAAVTLIAGPGVGDAHTDVQRINVVSATEMHDAALEHSAQADMFIGVAAVADYRPAQAATDKMKRSGKKGAGLTIELVENPDIIAAVAAQTAPPLVIGFAAETNDTLAHARAKRERKGLDAIVLNDVSQPGIGFNSDNNAATLIHAQGEMQFPMQPKSTLAENLLAQIIDIFGHRLATRDAESVSK